MPTSREGTFTFIECFMWYKHDIHIYIYIYIYLFDVLFIYIRISLSLSLSLYIYIYICMGIMFDWASLPYNFWPGCPVIALEVEVLVPPGNGLTRNPLSRCWDLNQGPPPPEPNFLPTEQSGRFEGMFTLHCHSYPQAPFAIRAAAFIWYDCFDIIIIIIII